ncbi:substrate-binding domain-containing protein [Cohnella faecalis]|uniref:Helix-turn-helix domain-containing protein n=1 Tax=Cohnella faecalis TaxID=2315694 RepID=A0A398CWJ5_9BACL|nr:helix-turn-helix transcriptional regulator [Cohnella faecalis]RIE03394.1 helix-turn-helix domain-containing protein [Cohnella faecalis]
MSQDMSYTTEEIAKLLKISKLTVYDLIKKGELRSYRVGKQMRVDASDLEQYKLRAKGGALPAAPRPISQAASGGPVRQLVITGQDISLDLLAKHLEKQASDVRPLRSFVGSMESLVALYRGEADIVSAHLIDGDTGEYNVPYVSRLLTGHSYLIVNLLIRTAGFYVAPGNPRGIQGFQDLAKPGLRIVNREKGSGARVLLDEKLRLQRISPSVLDGYEQEESNHMAVAGKVASGAADVGIGTEKAALIVGKVDFIPLVQERVDLVMLKTPRNLEWIEAVLSILRSEAFLAELGAIYGYDLSRTGQIVAET